MSESKFTIEAVDRTTKARVGQLQTAHGTVPTPMFMPVGTGATVKALTPNQVRDAGARIILGNTYHLNLRPGSALIRKLGGLHKFMGWSGPILTDSGGFQVFSLANLRKVQDDGITFRSHLDGSIVVLTPERVMEIQDDLGSDIAMVIDECPPHDCSRSEAEVAVRRTIRWAGQCRDEASRRGFDQDGRMVFGIVQGGRFPDLREQCAHALRAMDFPGYSIGGVSVGESESELLAQVDVTASLLPDNKPKYVMGVGTPPQLLSMIAMGIDLFDCVIPTREARHGVAYTDDGPINLKNSLYRDDERPLVEGLDNETCRYFSRAYLRHLVLSKEILGCTLLSLHNVSYFVNLMREARSHILENTFPEWSSRYLARYSSKSDAKS